jgi:serpin B
MKRRTVPLLAALLALAASACRSEDKPAKPDTAAVVEGNTTFALDLFGKLRAKEGNLFLSPFSISTALAMTSAGARGDTLTQMEKALHLPEQKKLHPAVAALLKEVNGDPKKRGYQLSTANRLFGQKGYPFEADFKKLTQEHYGAASEELDFAADTEAARKTINGWVEKQTEDRIKELLAPGVLDKLTRLVLVNAIYFKGDWASQFKKDRTREEGEFTLADGKTVETPLMRQRHKFGYHEADGLQVLEMPYAGKDLSMVVLLPRKPDGLPDLEKGLTTEKLKGLLGKLKETEVDVAFPRFRMTSTFELNRPLRDLGMELVFTDGKADLSGMNGGKEKLHLSAVIHKAFVDVNEQGTEAAGATAGLVKGRSLPANPHFDADHPFLFLIRDKRNGSILFLGRLANPKG